MGDEQLRQIYSSFPSPVITGSLAKRCSPPLLLSVTPDWNRSPFRLLILGQETLGWSFGVGNYYEWPYAEIDSYEDFFSVPSPVEALMHGYRSLEFAAKQPANYRSPFWRAFRYLRECLGAGAMWSNLFRFSVDGGSVINNCSKEEVEQILAAQGALLRKEVALLKPSAVVFFTGPRYDTVLRSQFSGTVLSYVPGYTIRQFAGVSAAELPSPSYRLYHPAYLSRTKRWDWLTSLALLLSPRTTTSLAR